jgi:RND family efflux transporter MFP subunit
MTVRPEPVQLTVDAYGTVVPRTESELVVQVAGEVVWVSPSLVAGGFFAEGDELVRIDPSDSEVSLEGARAAVARSESEASRARKERDRQRRLADQSVASQSRIDDAESAYRQAAALLREARALLRRAERDLDRTTLRAPFDGRVRKEQVDVGQFAGRGESIATLYAIDFAEVRLPVPDRDLSYLDLSLAWHDRPQELEDGPPVVLRAEFAGQPREWRGRIVRTEGELDPKSRMVHVVARVDDPYGRSAEGETVPLAVGLFVEAEIQGRLLEQAYIVPRSAIRQGDRVLVIDADGRLHHRDVTLVRLEAETAVLGADQLASGERLCVSPLATPIDGMRVRVQGDPDRDDP